MRVRSISVAVVAAVLALPVGAASAAGLVPAVQPFVKFDPAAKQFPEGIAVGPQGDVFTSMINLHQIWKLDPSGAHTVLAELNVSGKAPGGLAMAADGTIYAAVAALDLATGKSDPATRGIYRVRPDGTTERLAGTGAMAFPNDVKLDTRGNVYATDALAGEVWRVPPGGEAAVWAKHPLLAGDGRFNFGFPIGANGIAVHRNRVIVANSERSLLAEIPVKRDGRAGKPKVLAESPLLISADGIAVDMEGGIYVASAVLWTVVRVAPNGSIETLATASDGLNQPSTLAFGTTPEQRNTLFIANYSFFSPIPAPGVVKLPVSVPGQPLP